MLTEPAEKSSEDQRPGNGPESHRPSIGCGRRRRDRTSDLGLVRAALSQLSYPPVSERSASCRTLAYRSTCRLALECARELLAFDDTEGLATIIGWIEETGADLVVGDPLARLMVGNEDDTRDMGRVVKAIDILIDRLGVSVVIYFD